MAGKKQVYSMPPSRIPPLILVPTGETCIIDGKRCRILRIERASECDVNYNVKPKVKPYVKRSRS